MFSSKKIYYFITSLCFFTTTPLDADNTPGEKKPLEIKVKETPFKPNKPVLKTMRYLYKYFLTVSTEKKSPLFITLQRSLYEKV